MAGERGGRRRWLPTWREVLVVLAAALLGGALGWLTRPHRGDPGSAPAAQTAAPGAVGVASR